MNYADLLTPHHIALLHDWLAEAGGLYVYTSFPHSGGMDASSAVSSLDELKLFLSAQTWPEAQIFIFKGAEFEEFKLGRCFDLKWVYGNSAEVLYIALHKNRNYYEEYEREQEKYAEAVAKWRGPA